MKKQNNKNADFTFNAIVGNPPYTVHDSPNNPRSQTPVYPRFVELALKLKPKYFTFIIPGK
ncbi:Eco57I restriction-modification methylase domain-containing protein [bacterium]|nr:Eco57I restriction-modification methylase domain-containing protein [bacterium]